MPEPLTDIELAYRKLRKSNPQEFIRIYQSLLGSFASVANTEDVQALTHRLSRISQTNESSIQSRVELKSKNDFVRLPCDDAEITFLVSSTAELKQVLNFRDKEPETQDWIRGFSENDVFCDVGANIGLFTIFAACQPRKNITVMAFEPTFTSFHSLCWNSHSNNVSDNVFPFLCGLSDAISVETINFWRLASGTAKSVVGDPVDFRNQAFSPQARQHVPVYSLDGLLKLFNLPVPNHIKIDVDGIEFKVLAGASETLRRPEVRSVMVEAADSAMEERLLADFDRMGFDLAMRQNKKIENGGTRNNYFKRK